MAEASAREKLRVFADQKSVAFGFARRLLEGLETLTLNEMREARDFLSPTTVRR